MKKKLIIALIVVVIFIPTIIAIVAYNVAVNNPVTKGSVFEMEMTDIDGNSYKFSRDTKSDSENEVEKDPINFFVNLNNNAQELSELPPALNNSASYTVIYHSYNLQLAYHYYFSDNPNDAYFTTNTGKAFKINSNDAQKFVYSTYAIPLYKDAASPVMDIVGETVLPDSMTWNYKMSNGEYSEAMVPLYSGETQQVFSMSGGIHLNFSNQPDYLHVTVIEGDTTLFDDLYSNIGSVTFNESSTLSVSVTAKWYESASKDFYGEANYRFIANMRAPAEFYLGTSEVSQGDFVVITGKNVANLSSISFTSEPSINFTPVFFQDGEYVVALVPISYELTYSPAYTFTIMADGVENKLTLACAAKSFPTRNYGIDANIIAYKRTPATMEAFNTTLANVFADQLTTRYWTNQIFSSPCPSNRQVKVGVGAYITLSATGTTYRHQGVDYIVASGDQVMAACSGIVSYVGTLDLSGRTVVIDHGFGLKTLYAHLNSTSVEVGDQVTAGEIIGMVGETGFTTGVNLHFGMYIFDVPVRPYDALGYEKQGIQIVLP